MKKSKVEFSNDRFNRLSVDDKHYLCDLLPPKVVRKYFNDNPKGFHGICPGRVATKLSNKDTVALVKKNIETNFISSFLITTIIIWLTEIQDSISSNEDSGLSHNEALINTLAESVFSDRIGLYFNLIGSTYSEDYITIITEFVNKELQKQNEIAASQAEVFESEIVEVEFQQGLERSKSESAELLEYQSLLEQEKNAHIETQSRLAESKESELSLYAKLADIEAERSSLNTICTELKSEIEKLKGLYRYADVDTIVHTHDYQYTSLCQVYYDSSEHIWISRLADIRDGKIIPFIKDDTLPNCFGNRDRLFWKDGPTDSGFVGCWYWSADPNKSNSSSDYIRTAFTEEIQPTEIMFLPSCESLEDIVEYLVNGIEIETKATKILFTCEITSLGLHGLLCQSKDFDVVNSKFRLKESVYKLPVFQISNSNIITIQSRNYYETINLGMPQCVISVKSPYAVVKDIIISRATNARLRQLSLSNKESQHLRSFISDLPNDELTEEIARIYGCSIAEAERYVTEFVGMAYSCLENSDVDTALLATAISRNQEFLERCKDLIYVDWKSENDELLSNAKDELDRITLAVEQQSSRLTDVHQKTNELTNELIKLNEEISSRKSLAEEVEIQVNERIRKAREDAAAFIAEMAFTTPLTSAVTPVDKSSGSKLDLLSARKVTSNPMGEMDDIDDFVEELSENLELSGYESVPAAQMAQVIAFCIVNHLPLICGSNSEIVADSISATLGNTCSYITNIPASTSDASAYYEAIENACDVRHQVFVVHGIMDYYTLEHYHHLMRSYPHWCNSPVLILSIQGVDKSSIQECIWDSAMYIDGDYGYTKLHAQSLNSFSFNNDLRYDELDAESIYKKRTLFKSLKTFVSEQSITLYSQFLCWVDGGLSTEAIIEQLVLRAISINDLNGLQDRLSSDLNIDLPKRRYYVVE